jgi:flagellar basal-body rod protein FlgB
MDLPGADRITSLLNTMLSVESRRSQLSAGNIANADTPGYAPRELEFEEFLRDAARAAVTPQRAEEGAGLFAAEPRVVERQGGAAGLDGNAVDLQREMTEMAEAGMRYTMGVQLLQSRLRTLRTAIREGR